MSYIIIEIVNNYLVFQNPNLWNSGLETVFCLYKKGEIVNFVRLFVCKTIIYVKYDH